MIFKQKIGYFLLAILPIGHAAYADVDSCEIISRSLVRLNEDAFYFYTNGDFDSLNFYSNLCSSRLTNYIKHNPFTLKCKFDSLTKNGNFGIATTANGDFRIYSWNTWLGGSMYKYGNLFQFKLNGKVQTKQFDHGKGDMGTFYKEVYTLRANSHNYLVAISYGTESSKYYYQMITIFKFENGKITDDANIIKTAKGMKNYRGIEYDVTYDVSKSDWIKYNPQKRIIYIPIIQKNGKITGKFTRYKFTGQYFEKLAKR